MQEGLGASFATLCAMVALVGALTFDRSAAGTEVRYVRKGKEIYKETANGTQRHGRLVREVEGVLLQSGSEVDPTLYFQRKNEAQVHLIHESTTHSLKSESETHRNFEKMVKEDLRNRYGRLLEQLDELWSVLPQKVEMADDDLRKQLVDALLETGDPRGALSSIVAAMHLEAQTHRPPNAVYGTLDVESLHISFTGAQIERSGRHVYFFDLQDKNGRRRPSVRVTIDGNGVKSALLH